MTVLLPSPPDEAPRAIRSAFLVGAPRCGTTFLAKVLARHPEVAFSKPKETHFFVRDAAMLAPERWRDEFLRRHFAALEPAHTRMMEGSPLQLRDPQAIDRLLRFDPGTRFVVAIRNPITMIHSFHARLVYLLDEDEPDFERAWALQAARARGERRPKRCRDLASLQYREMAALGTQLARLFEQAGRERVHVVVFDDITADAVKVYRDLLEFLGLPDDGRTRFRARNEHREFRSVWLQRWLMNPPRPVLAWLESRQRKGKPRPEWVRALRRRIKRWNTRPESRAALAPAMHATLRAELSDEITKLEDLLGRDFGHWR